MDGIAAPIDSLMVINHLNLINTGGSGEGEAGGEMAILATASAEGEVPWSADQGSGQHASNLPRNGGRFDRQRFTPKEDGRWATPDDALRIGREMFEKEKWLEARQNRPDQGERLARWWEGDFLDELASIVHRGVDCEVLDRVFGDWR